MPIFAREVEIDAPIETVWGFLSNPDHWPQWFPGIQSVSMAMPIREGATFEWSSEGQSGQGTVVKMQPMKYLEIITQIGDDKDAHVFKMQPIGKFLGLGEDECKVEYTLDTLMGGGIIGRFVAGGNPKDTMRVKKALHLLRKLVEKE